MGVNVNSIDMVKVKQDLKSCPKSVRDYVKSLESLYESQKDLNAKCIHRVRELSLENTSLIVSRNTYAAECVKASLEKASEGAKIHFCQSENPKSGNIGNHGDVYIEDLEYETIKTPFILSESITSPDNIVLL